MEDSYEQGHQLRSLAMRVAALEDNVAFLERWCEEQQDSLDRAVGSVGSYAYGVDLEPDLPPPTVLRVVDLRDDLEDGQDGETDMVVAFVDPDQERMVRLFRAQLNRLRSRLAASLAPPADQVSARPAGRTAP